MLALAAAQTVLWAQTPAPPDQAGAVTPTREASHRKDTQDLAARIDQLVAAQWTANEVRPAPRADDAEFIRRAYLDLAGKIPSVTDLREFLDDPAPDKRQRLIERLLASPAYVKHFTNVWRTWMLPEANANIAIRAQQVGFEAWLHVWLKSEKGYDQMVRELLTTTFNTPIPPQAGRPITPSQATTLAFYQANENKAENLAASTSRLFLGVKLECAQCHNHPFAKWSREQFWGYAAFFVGQPGRPVRAGDRPPSRGQLTIPGTDKVVKARFLDDKEPGWEENKSGGVLLADWMTAADNPYFARAAVNRMWAYFFGTGLVEPFDEMGDANEPSHPELLDELARQFTAHNFDLKFLIRAIVNSQAYQLTSARTHESQDDPRLFARMAIKGLSPEQLYESVAQATGYQDPTPPNQVPIRVLNNSPSAELLNKFANSSDKRTEVQTSILQALSLMNGRLITDATSLERSETLAAIADAPFMDTAQRIETLYLTTLSRKPRPEEAARLVAYVNSGGPSNDAKKALADVFWALLNTSEFILNH
jgi:hypothetical protein